MANVYDAYRKLNFGNRLKCLPTKERKKFYVVFALFVEVFLHEHGAHSHAHVGVHLCHAIFPSGRRLFPAEQNVIKLLLRFLKPIVQVVHSVPDESPEKIIRDSPANETHARNIVWLS